MQTAKIIPFSQPKQICFHHSFSAALTFSCRRMHDMLFLVLKSSANNQHSYLSRLHILNRATALRAEHKRRCKSQTSFTRDAVMSTVLAKRSSERRTRGFEAWWTNIPQFLYLIKLGSKYKRYLCDLYQTEAYTLKTLASAVFLLLKATYCSDIPIDDVFCEHRDTLQLSRLLFQFRSSSSFHAGKTI